MLTALVGDMTNAPKFDSFVDSRLGLALKEVLRAAVGRMEVSTRGLLICLCGGGGALNKSSDGSWVEYISVSRLCVDFGYEVKKGDWKA